MSSNDRTSEDVETAAREPVGTPAAGACRLLRDRLGGFLSLWGVVLVSLGIGGIGIFLDEVGYAQESDPVEVASLAGLSELEDGDYVRLTGSLDYERGILSDKIAGEAYLLAPLEGTGLRFWVSLEGGVAPTTRKEITVCGRVVARSGSYWTIGDGRDLDLRYQAKKLHAVDVPESALVLRDGVAPGDGMVFACIAGGVGFLIVVTLVGRLLGAVAAVAGRGRAPEPLADAAA